MSFSAKLTVSKIALSRTITFRNIKNIELSLFSNEVDNLNTDGLLSLDELTSYYNDQLQNVLDVVALLELGLSHLLILLHGILLSYVC